MLMIECVLLLKEDGKREYWKVERPLFWLQAGKKALVTPTRSELLLFQMEMNHLGDSMNLKTFVYGIIEKLKSIDFSAKN